MTTIAYRPRGVPELIDAAFQLMRRHYVQLLVLAAMTYLPLFGIFIIVGAPMAMTTNPDDFSGGAFALFFLAMPFLAAWYAVGSAAMLLGASEAYQGRDVVPGQAMSTALKRWWPIIKASLAKLALIYVAFLAVTIAGALLAAALGFLLGPFGFLVILPAFVFPLLVWARFFAVPAVTILEGLGTGESLSRSSTLSEGFRWKILGTLVVAYLIIGAIGMGAWAVTFLIVKNMVFAQIANTLLSLLGFPLVSTIIITIYYDMRIRKEGFDLELLEREIGASSAPQPS
jgi:hypothetical protein